MKKFLLILAGVLFITSGILLAESDFRGIGGYLIFAIAMSISLYTVKRKQE